MLDREIAKREIEKFGQLNFRPTTAIALGVLIDKLASVSRNEAHCRSIVEAILDNPGEDERWPTSKTIGDVAWNLLSEAERAVGCLDCNGTGWRSTQKRVGAMMYDCADPCTCRPAPPAEPEPEQKRPAKVVEAEVDGGWYR